MTGHEIFSRYPFTRKFIFKENFSERLTNIIFQRSRSERRHHLLMFTYISGILGALWGARPWLFHI